jgi:prepilin-type processing-associated H-X9-DG protein
MPTVRPGSEEPYVNDYNRRSPRWQWFLETDSGPVIDPQPFKRLNEPFGDDGLMLGYGEGRRMTIDLFTCPSLDDPSFAFDIRDGAYGYNYQYLGNTRTDEDPDRWDNFAVGMHTIKCPGQTVLLADSRGAGPRHGKNSFMLDPPRLAVEANARRFGPAQSDVLSSSNRELLAYSPVEARHDDTGNVTFVDGHAEPMTLLELGYEVNNAHLPGMETVVGLPKDMPLPRSDVTSGPYQANNRLWNGLCNDPVANQANGGGGGG